jgi:hypothetical protein
MNTIKILAGSMMLLMAAITIICGMWVKTNHITDPGSLKFHMISGGITAVVMIIYFVMTIKTGR